MRNYFFLVIPEQQSGQGFLVPYEKEAVNQWVLELPAANPSLSTRLLVDFIEGFNKAKMSAQQRLDVLEMIRPSFLMIEDFLRSRLIASGFPKGTNELKIFNLLVSLQRGFTVGYWVAVRELSGRDVGWFQGKNIALSIQRTIRGLSEIIVTQYMMFIAVPDWVWIDLHSLYKLSLKTKKESTKVADISCLHGKSSTAEDCYKQVLLLSLTDPSGLMQKEVGLVYQFIASVAHLIQIVEQPVENQDRQCIVLMDEDTPPYFETTVKEADSSMLYLDLSKLYKALESGQKYSSQDEPRFSSMQKDKSKSRKLSVDLFEYICQCWQGEEVSSVALFADRLDRYVVIGLDATHSIQSGLEEREQGDVTEVLAESFSDRELACRFDKEGVLSIGSLVSIRKKTDPEKKRMLGIVKKITMSRQGDEIIFAISAITSVSYAVAYTDIDAEKDADRYKALLYGIKTKTGEKSFIIVESFMHKNEDGMRLYMNGKDFPIVLGNRKNIGLGYWQFECRQIEEKQVQQVIKKKGYDFI